MGDLWKDLKKRPAVLIGIGFAIVAVLYIVYKSNAGNSSASSSGSSTNPNAMNGTGSQLGGYIQFEEDVLNPPNVNVTLGGSTTKTPVTVNTGGGNDDGNKHHRAPGPSHPPVHHPRVFPPVPVSGKPIPRPVDHPPTRKPPIPIPVDLGPGAPGHRPVTGPPTRVPPGITGRVNPIPVVPGGIKKVIKSPVTPKTPPTHNSRVIMPPTRAF